MEKRKIGDTQEVSNNKNAKTNNFGIKEHGTGQQNNTRYNHLSIIISVMALLFSIFTFCYNKHIQDYNAETEKMIQEANNEFLSVRLMSNYEVLVEKYKQIQKRKPTDNTGCDKFLDKVEKDFSQGTCNSDTKVLLQYAKDLNTVKDNIRLNNDEEELNNQ